MHIPNFQKHGAYDYDNIFFLRVQWILRRALGLRLYYLQKWNCFNIF